MFAFEIVAEQRIKEAMERGDFDNLPGSGKPLPKDNIDQMPPELRASAIILKNANVIPEEMLLKKEISNLQQMIEACYDDTESPAFRQGFLFSS